MSQMKDIPTHQNYHKAMIFTEHYSDISYVHLQKSLTSNETVQAKRDLDTYIQKLGVKIRH